MSPRLALLLPFVIATVAHAEESCCAKPVSRAAMLTGGKTAAPAETCEECDAPAKPQRKLWPVLSLSAVGAAAVGALYVRRTRLR